MPAIRFATGCLGGSQINCNPPRAAERTLQARFEARDREGRAARPDERTKVQLAFHCDREIAALATQANGLDLRRSAGER